LTQQSPRRRFCSRYGRRIRADGLHLESFYIAPPGGAGQLIVGRAVPAFG